MAGVFITSTDTDAGKTTVALSLMRHYQSIGKSVTCMKPISAGCIKTYSGLRNDDAIKLMQESTVDIPYETINPYAFEPPIAPHIAARQENKSIQLDKIKQNYNEIAKQADIVVVEGAGGWLVPINDSEYVSDIALSLHLPVILVVGMRLGCLNHALLTANTIEHAGIKLIGWIANHVDPNMLQQEENILTLNQHIPVPFIGSIAYEENVENAHISFNKEFNIDQLC